MNIHKVIGDNIRFARQKLAWTQIKLGENCGLHGDFIGRLERGQENVSVDNLEKIAMALGLKIQNLFIEGFVLERDKSKPSS